MGSDCVQLTGSTLFVHLSEPLRLSPFVGGVGEAFVHDRVEAATFLDEDFGEGAILAKKDGLEANEFQQSEEHGNEGAR